MSKANKIQIGGDHYKMNGGGEEHWDRVFRLKLDYFQAAVTKYVERCWKKNGIQDLQKAKHFLDKYIELNTPPETEVDLTSAATFASSVDGIEFIYLGQEEGTTGVKVNETDGFKIIEKVFDITKGPATPFTFTPGQVLPTGWVQFVFEGVDSGGCFFTCKECGGKFHAAVGTNPHASHGCKALVESVEQAHRAAEANSAYVNQG